MAKKFIYAFAADEAELGLGLLRRLAGRRAAGLSPTFGDHHVLLALLELGAAKSMGRLRLGRELGLGEGAVRNLLSRLRRRDIVTSDRRGCRLTRRGLRLYEQLRLVLRGPYPVQAGRLALDKYSCALLVRGGGAGVRFGIEQRDEGIKVGASGIVTLVYAKGKFAMPGGSGDCEADYGGPEWPELRRLLAPEEGDAIIVSSAPSPVVAKLAALAAGASLLGERLKA